MGKVWFITGASSGFGRSLAEDLIARGERVVVAARKLDAMQDLVARASSRVLALRLDVTDPASIAAALEAAALRFGELDVLINNAGYSMIGALEETSDEALRDVMETMFFGPVALTKALLPRMRARKSGIIVQITSVGGLTTAPGFGAYCAAKHALEGLSECLAKELAPFGVRVLIVEPGAFRTSLFGSAFRALPALPEYAASVGTVREWVESQAGKQSGDPAKGARAIIEAVQSGAPNLRLPLGGDAVDNLRAKLSEVAADIDASEPAARATAFD